MKHETVLIIDFGGQYNQLIARRVREAKDVKQYLTKAMDKIKEVKPEGIIFTGGPSSVNDPGAPDIEAEIFDLGIPILGICYGAQLTAKVLRWKRNKTRKREYGKTEINYTGGKLFKDVDKSSICWMSHTDQIDKLPEGFTITAATHDWQQQQWKMQTNFMHFSFIQKQNMQLQGYKIIRNFLFEVCALSGDFTSDSFIDDKVRLIRQQVGDKKTFAHSGGVDSSVAAVLVHKAIGDNLTCIFVDHGLLRKNEGDDVEKNIQR